MKTMAAVMVLFAGIQLSHATSDACKDIQAGDMVELKGTKDLFYGDLQLALPVQARFMNRIVPSQYVSVTARQRVYGQKEYLIKHHGRHYAVSLPERTTGVVTKVQNGTVFGKTFRERNPEKIERFFKASCSYMHKLVSCLTRSSDGTEFCTGDVITFEVPIQEDQGVLKELIAQKYKQLTNRGEISYYYCNRDSSFTMNTNVTLVKGTKLCKDSTKFEMKLDELNLKLKIRSIYSDGTLQVEEAGAQAEFNYKSEMDYVHKRMRYDGQNSPPYFWEEYEKWSDEGEGRFESTRTDDFKEIVESFNDLKGYNLKVEDLRLSK